MEPTAVVNPMIGIVLAVVWLGFILLMLVSGWKVYAKADQPGWGALVPIYNLILMCKIAGKPGWWVLLCFIPVVNFIIAIMLMLGLAKNFGKSTGFAIGLILLAPIFLPILAFDNSKYVAATA